MFSYYLINMEKHKEPTEVRKERIRMAKSMTTKTSKNPKAYDRNKLKTNLSFFKDNA